MPGHRRILFAVDESPHCRRAFQWFLKWMWKGGNRSAILAQTNEESEDSAIPIDKLEPEEDAITLIHVIHPDLASHSTRSAKTEIPVSPSESEGSGGTEDSHRFMEDSFTAGKTVCQVFLKLAMEAGATRCDACIAVDRRQSTGKSILRLAEKRSVDMVVIGSHGHSTLHRVVHLGSDEQKEVIQTLAWLEQEWQDPLLSWEPEHFGDIQSIHVPAEELWRPDIVLYNNVDGKYEITTMTRAEIFSNGTVRWMPPALYLSAFRIDMEYFPYDEQTCSMRFGSWTYDGSKVELRHHLQKFAPELQRPLHIDYAADLHDFGSTVEYDIISVSAICSDTFYQHSVHPYPEITFKLRMRRRSAFYTFNGEDLSINKHSPGINSIFSTSNLGNCTTNKPCCATGGKIPVIHNRTDHVIDSMDGCSAKRIFQNGRDSFCAELLSTKRSKDQFELVIMKNKWTTNKNGLADRKKGYKLPSSTKKKEFSPLTCQITRQLIEQCSDNTQIRLLNKLSQAAEGSRFIEQQLRITEEENDIFLSEVFCYKEASRLYDVLINQQGYNKNLRPVANVNNTLTVFFGLGLLKLMDLDEVNQILTTNVWVELEWTDYKLVWEPEDFGGVTVLFIPSELLWLPDLLLYNNADGNYVIDIMTKAIVFYNGTVRWTPPAIFKSSCPINVQYFPYDIQECFMKFGSWTYNGRQVSLKHITQKRIPEHEGNVHIDHAINLKDFYPSVEFELLQVSAIRRAEYYTCCADPFIDVTFKLALRRKTLFYTINLIIPCVGIAFLTILVFYLPSQSGGKIALSINVLLGLSVFLFLLTESIPPTGLAMPLIGKYLLFTMGLVSLSILKTIFVLNLHHSTPDKPAPNFGTGKLARRFLWLIGLQTLKGTKTAEHENSTWPATADQKVFLTISKSVSPAERRLLKFIHNLRTLAGHFSKLEKRKRIQEEWIYLARISDRVFLCIFMAVCLTGAFAVLFYSPPFYDNQDELTSNNMPAHISLRLEGKDNASDRLLIFPNV
ncbi:hypothetical protein Aperf_G00000073625 [Anoplocephala perfoliata]